MDGLVVSHVLDASALLACMYEEPGKDRVEQLLLRGECAISAANLAELVAKCADTGMSRDDIATVVHGFDVDVVPMTAEQAFAAGMLRPATRHLGLSLGDRACLALAQSLNATALTADRVWTQIDAGIRIECIRPD